MERLKSQLEDIKIDAQKPTYIYFRYNSYYNSLTVNAKQISVSGILKSVEFEDKWKGKVVITDFNGKDISLNLTDVQEVHLLTTDNPANLINIPKTKLISAQGK